MKTATNVITRDGWYKTKRTNEDKAVIGRRGLGILIIVLTSDDGRISGLKVKDVIV